jgi:hypothetical protein
MKSEEPMELITEAELNQTVYVPAGNGAPVQWKRLRDLRRDEMERHIAWKAAEIEHQSALLKQVGR